MKLVGTIFATSEQLSKADAHSDRQKRKREETASALLENCERRVEGGETRFYASPSKYAIASRSGAIRWFEIRNGFHFACK